MEYSFRYIASFRDLPGRASDEAVSSYVLLKTSKESIKSKDLNQSKDSVSDFFYWLLHISEQSPAVGCTSETLSKVLVPSSSSHTGF